MEVIPVSTAAVEGGGTIFTDCTGFAVVKALRLKKALVFDKHFE